MTDLLNEFHDVDTTERVDDFLHYLEACEGILPLMQAREESYRALAGAVGRGVDVGCGTGAAVGDLAERGLHPIGIDRSRGMVAAARRRLPALDFFVSSAAELPFEDQSLNWYRGERLYVGLPNPGAALAEAYRVLASGATIVLLDPDLETATWTSTYPGQTRVAVTAMAENSPNGRAGTRTAGLLHGAGFVDVEVTARAMLCTDLALAGVVLVDLALDAAVRRDRLTELDAAKIREDVDVRARRGTFMAAWTVFMTQARRP